MFETLAIKATIEAEAGKMAECISTLLKSLETIPPGHPKYTGLFDQLATAMESYGLLALERQESSGELARQHPLLAPAFRRAEGIATRRERERMIMFDEDALEKPITLSEAQNPRDVREMLLDETGVKLFEEFCAREGIDHYVRYWCDVENFKALEGQGYVLVDPKKPKKKRRVLKIYP